MKIFDTIYIECPFCGTVGPFVFVHCLKQCSKCHTDFTVPLKWEGVIDCSECVFRVDCISLPRGKVVEWRGL